MYNKISISYSLSHQLSPNEIPGKISQPVSEKNVGILFICIDIPTYKILCVWQTKILFTNKTETYHVHHTYGDQDPVVITVLFRDDSWVCLMVIITRFSSNKSRVCQLIRVKITKVSQNSHLNLFYKLFSQDCLK